MAPKLTGKRDSLQIPSRPVMLVLCSIEKIRESGPSEDKKLVTASAKVAQGLKGGQNVAQRLGADRTLKGRARHRLAAEE